MVRVATATAAAVAGRDRRDDGTKRISQPPPPAGGRGGEEERADGRRNFPPTVPRRNHGGTGNFQIKFAAPAMPMETRGSRAMDRPTSVVRRSTLGEQPFSRRERRVALPIDAGIPAIPAVAAREAARQLLPRIKTEFPKAPQESPNRDESSEGVSIIILLFERRSRDRYESFAQDTRLSRLRDLLGQCEIQN